MYGDSTGYRSEGIERSVEHALKQEVVDSFSLIPPPLVFDGLFSLRFKGCIL